MWGEEGGGAVVSKISESDVRMHNAWNLQPFGKVLVSEKRDRQHSAFHHRDVTEFRFGSLSSGLVV